MSSSSTDTNILIGRFMNLQESWEDNPDKTDWAAVDAVARDGASAYNDGAGHSFHFLMLDGVPHTAFHERFLKSSLDAGFDPFTLTTIGQGSAPVPVLDHDTLAEAAKENASSAAMQEMIRQFARKRFDSGENGNWTALPADQRQRILETGAGSIPADLLDELRRSV